MTPYELRFNIFKEAGDFAQNQYYASFALAEEWNKNNSVKMDYPTFPTYDEIEDLAFKINQFVSSK